jgi:hypothetical protein
VTDQPRTVSFAITDRHVRIALVVVAGFQALMAVLFVLQVSWAIAIWPYAGRTQFSNTFIASIFLAAAASIGWCLLVRSDRALSGIALDILTIFVPFAVFSFATAMGGGGANVAGFGLVCAVGALLGLWLLRWSLRHPWRDPRPTPGLVRASFVIFVIALVGVSVPLILQVPGILPWRITPQLSTMYGIMFLGASAYFAYGVVVPCWENAGGQLAGFLAYDIVLIVPLARELLSGGGGGGDYDIGRNDPLRLNLIIYTAVITYSGLLAIYYLLIRRETRVWTPVPAASDRESA